MKINKKNCYAYLANINIFFRKTWEGTRTSYGNKVKRKSKTVSISSIYYTTSLHENGFK